MTLKLNRMCRPTPFNTSGFTLLEVLTVLFIMGLVSAVAIPNLPVMQASFDFALKRDTFEQTMNGLAYQAFKNNQDYTLAGIYDVHGFVENPHPTNPDSTDGIPNSMRTLPILGATRALRPPVTPAPPPLNLPDGWTLEVNEPIYYRASGYCTGGTAELKIGRRTYTYRMVPPLCELSLDRS